MSELPDHASSRGEDLDLIGGETVVGATVHSLRYRSLTVAKPLRARRKTRFVDCHFVGWRIGRAILDGVSFERCVLSDIRMGWISGVESMVDCTVDGVFGMPLSGRHPIIGNDFSRAIRIGFMDGVRFDLNRFAIDGSQLIVSKEHHNWPRVLARAASGDPVADTIVKHLCGRQSWEVLYRTETDPADWAFYAEHFGDDAPSAETPERLLPSFGQGQIGFTEAADDDDAWRRGHLERPQPLFDVHLTPAGLQVLGEALGLSQSNGCTLVREDDARMLVRLEKALFTALRGVTDRQLLLQDWNERTRSLGEGEWADDPGPLLDYLLRLARRRTNGNVYAVLSA